MNEVASMAAILVTFVTVIFFFFKKKKKIPGYKESLFVLNHLIHIFSIYMYYIYIYDNLILARSVGTSYSA